MGWSSGPVIAEEVWLAVRPHLNLEGGSAEEQKLADKIIAIFDQHDADDWSQAPELTNDSSMPAEDFDEDER